MKLHAKENLMYVKTLILHEASFFLNKAFNRNDKKVYLPIVIRNIWVEFY